MKPSPIPALLCAALLCAAPAAAGVRHTERSDRVVEARGIRVLEVDNARGDVRVTPSADGRIHLTALKIARGRDKAEAERYAAQISVTAGAQGERYAVRVSYPKRVDVRINFWDLLAGREDGDDIGPSHELRLVLEVPPATELNLKSVSGDLATRDMAGPQRLRTTSGDCAVTAAGAAVDVGTVSGDVALRGGRRALVRTTSGDVLASGAGPLDARTVSGDIDVEGDADSLALGSTSGDLSVQRAPKGLDAATTSGEIDVLAASGIVGLRSTSGDIDAVFEAPLARVTAANSSGSVTLGLPPGLGAELELTTTSGDIACDVPVVLLGHGRQHLNAKYGRGGASVKAHTVSGDLHVTSGGR